MEFQSVCWRLSCFSCTRCLLQPCWSSERQVCGAGIGWSMECNEEQGGGAFHRQHREKCLRHGLEGWCNPQVGIIILHKEQQPLLKLMSCNHCWSNSRSSNEHKRYTNIFCILGPNKKKFDSMKHVCFVLFKCLCSSKIFFNNWAKGGKKVHKVGS